MAQKFLFLAIFREASRSIILDPLLIQIIYVDILLFNLILSILFDLGIRLDYLFVCNAWGEMFKIGLPFLYINYINSSL